MEKVIAYWKPLIIGPQIWPHQEMLTQKKIKARRKRRKELFWGQMSFIGLSLLCLSALSSLAGHSGFSVSGAVSADSRASWGSRRLLQMPKRNETVHKLEKNCTEPALNEFPTDLFSQRQRLEGALLLHILCAVYVFFALALVCDDYFVPSLEKISERLQLSEDVAGATFMAAGSSAPELFTSIIGVFITKGDVGVGTIVGSAVFNILCIIGVCGIFAGQAIRLSYWALLRDSVYYTIAVAALILVIYDEKVSWQESLVLILMYLVYILIMKFNSPMLRYLEQRNKDSASLANGTGANMDADDGNCDATVVLLKKASFRGKQSVLMVDELLSAYPHQLTFSEAGMRIMITSHFSPRTRLTMASRMLIMERQRLISGKSFSNGDSDVVGKVPGRRNLDDRLSGAERGVKGQHGCHAMEDGECMEPGTDTENEDNENEEEEEENEGPFVPFHVPEGPCPRLKWALAWPVSLLLYFTVPNCAEPRWERYFLATFFISTLWIAAFSYVMVWMVTVIGFTLWIPDVIMGITFLAAGTSVPDCMSSLIVARQGLGDMAVSNSIGSNVFDILVGLGLPWALQTLAVDYNSYIRINSKGLIYSVGLLLASVFLTVLGVHLNKWTLNRKLGLFCMLLYSVFLCVSILIEFNVFTFINKPTCRDL
ncbi:sodium/potassium/calcium exchanger 3-like isoform X1 [Brienomyrus brachyistius]|uniref:sodium/potassium/calcium exchanger 3-like isoform X1 n=2 Tax=Brienomyrus brachyistius TaxID=42636 RepID=UPI0020B24CCA|nr:sodium/potassium/calcium exchanger 3-like isoform X1 [Brienomyrus brachyistius]